MDATLAGEPVVIHRRDVSVPFGLLGLDVETTYLTDRTQWDPDFRVRTVQFATKDEAWIFDAGRDRDDIRQILGDERRFFCSHTNMDVLSVWREFGIDITARNIDTRGL